MSRPLPKYTQEEINRLFAYVLQSGYDRVGRDTRAEVDSIADNMYVLVEEEEDDGALEGFVDSVLGAQDQG